MLVFILPSLLIMGGFCQSARSFGYLGNGWVFDALDELGSHEKGYTTTLVFAHITSASSPLLLFVLLLAKI